MMKPFAVVGLFALALLTSASSQAEEVRIDTSAYRHALAAALSSPDSPCGAIPRRVADAFASALPEEVVKEESRFAGGEALEAIGWNIHFDSMPVPWDTTRQVWAFYTTTQHSGLVTILERQGDTVRYKAQRGKLETLMMPIVHIGSGKLLGIDGTVITATGFWGAKMRRGKEILSWDGATCDRITPCDVYPGTGFCDNYLNGRKWSEREVDGDGVLEILVSPDNDRGEREKIVEPVVIFKYDKASRRFVRFPTREAPQEK